MNKALKGNNQEIVYTKILNQKNKFWEDICYDKNTTFAIHVTGYKYGKINEAKIPVKADIYFASGKIPHEYLLKKDFYLNETDVSKFDLKPIAKSGLSIKMANSSYTITKISSSIFIKIFGSNILGAGSSIYCKKEVEFDKNTSVLKGWQVNEIDFKNYFSNKLGIEISLSDKTTLNKIKDFSNKEISKIINESNKISDILFKGIGNFEEPYTAHWIIENDDLKPNYYIPFKVTTGSGRTNGTFTIVLKPK